MKDKKGTIEISTEFVIHLVFAIFLIAALVLVIVNLLSVLEKKDAEAECINDKYWNNQRGLKDILKKVDKGENQEFLFINENCNLVSFSFVQGIEANPISYSQSLPREPMLCLCMIESSLLGTDECKQYDCYKFKNYDQINSQQFSTKDLEKFVFLSFKKNGKTLNIDALGTQKKPEPLTYSKPEFLVKTDQTGLIQKLVVLFTTRDIKAFTPIVKIKEAEFLLPANIQNIEGFTTFFDLDLASPPLYGQTEENYLVDHSSISSDLVKEATITLSLEKDKVNRLTEQQKQAIYLYYKSSNVWKESILECIDSELFFLCTAALKEFSSNFAISTPIHK